MNTLDHYAQEYTRCLEGIAAADIALHRLLDEADRAGFKVLSLMLRAAQQKVEREDRNLEEVED